VLTSSQGSTVYGQSLTLIATAGNGSPPIPTGSVTFLDGSTVLGSAALNSSGTASFTVSSLAAGSHLLTASYGGDGTSPAGSSAPLDVAVSPATLFVTA